MRESSLLDRVLPEGERQSAVWFAVAAACIFAARFITSAVVFRLTSSKAGGPGVATFLLLAYALPAALVFALVWAFIRFTRTPREFALFLSLATVVSFAFTVLRTASSAVISAALPNPLAGPANLGFSRLGGTLATAAINIIVAVLAAWLAQRPTDTSEPDLGLLAAIGWRGTPAEGDAQLAVGYAVSLAVLSAGTWACGIVPEVIQQAAMQHVENPIQALNRSAIIAGLAFIPLVAIVVFALSWLLIRRWGQPASWWLVYLGMSVATVLSAFQTASFAPSIGQLLAMGRGEVLSLLAPIVILVMPFFGAWLATRGDRGPLPSDTLPAEEDV